MVVQQDLPVVPELHEPVGILKLDAGEGKQWSCLADGVAYELKRSVLLAASVVGSGTEVKAWRAALSCETKLSFVWAATGGYDLTLTKDPDGYDLHVAPLGLGAWHLVATAKREDFVPCMDEEAVWQNLVRRTTTPIMREWMPQLVRRLHAEDLLTAATAHGRLAPGLLNVTTKSLDELVAAGLRQRTYRIVA
jgi:hypothetical protein